jgi:hypothetical protein
LYTISDYAKWNTPTGEMKAEEAKEKKLRKNGRNWNEDRSRSRIR